jgi:hypothetical protein
MRHDRMTCARSRAAGDSGSTFDVPGATAKVATATEFSRLGVNGLESAVRQRRSIPEQPLDQPGMNV